MVRLCNVINETLNETLNEEKKKCLFLREHSVIIRVYKLAKSEP